MEWDVAMAVYGLPSMCTDAGSPYASACAAAAATVQARLGDIDAALADEEARSALLALPLPALAALLRSDKTRASGEAMVYFVADAWLDMRGRGTEAERCTLADCVRVHHLPSSYIASVVAASQWLAWEGRMQAAATWAALPQSLKAGKLENSEDGPFAAFGAPPRPCHRSTAQELAWDVPLADLEILHTKATAKQGVDSVLSSDDGAVRHWGGYKWGLKLSAVHHAGRGVVEFGVSVVAAVPPSGEGCATLVAECVVRAEHTISSCSVEARGRAVFNDVAAGFDDDTTGWGCWSDFFGLGPQSTWDEGAWHKAGLVKDGKVRLRLRIDQVY